MELADSLRVRPLAVTTDASMTSQRRRRAVSVTHTCPPLPTSSTRAAVFTRLPK